MASDDDMTSDSLDVTVTDVPENLQGYVKTKVAEYIAQSKDVSMKIHQAQGQSPRLVISFGTNTGKNKRFTFCLQTTYLYIAKLGYLGMDISLVGSVQYT